MYKNRYQIFLLQLAGLAFIMFAGCNKPATEKCSEEQGLYAVSGFPIGCALNTGLLQTNERYKEIAVSQFNSITPENIFKASYLQPEQNVFYWQEADELANFCKQHNKRLHGHTLIWHDQLPQWIIDYHGSRLDWDILMKMHIQAVVSHFKGKVTGWDVVNEAFNEDGTLRNSIWKQKIGDSYIEKAFMYAHEADPDALLFYNDFFLEMNPTKRKAVLSLLNHLKWRGVRVDGIGLQMHVSTVFPEPWQVTEALQEVVAAGYKIHLSEVDISVNPLSKKNVDLSAALQEQQSDKLLLILKCYQQIPAKYQYGITFWGIGDADSWIRSYYNRQDYPLLYDDEYNPKPVYCKFKSAL